MLVTVEKGGAGKIDIMKILEIGGDRKNVLAQGISFDIYVSSQTHQEQDKSRRNIEKGRQERNQF